jgi:RecB family exonuclease
LQQITSELATVNPHLTLTQIGLTNKQKEIPESKLEILKSPDVVQRIREVIETKLSASSINRYLDSPLEWYYAYVLKLEDKTPSAELDPATFGSLVHEALNNLKKPFINQELTEAMVDQMIGGAKAELQRQFESNPLSRQYAIGLNHVHFKVATRLVKRFLKSEKTCIAAGESIVYLASEQKLGRKLTVEWEGEQITAVFTGSADSVERRNGELRMVDYKTGKVSSADMALGSFEMDTIAKKPKVLQLLLYSWMGQLEYPGENIHGQIISMPTPAVRSIAPKVGINDPDGRASFEELLATIVRHMLDSNERISANEDFKYAVFE